MCVHLVFQNICDNLVAAHVGVTNSDIAESKAQLLLFLNDKYCKELLFKADSFIRDPSFNSDNAYHRDKLYKYLYEQALWFFRDKIIKAEKEELAQINNRMARSDSPIKETGIVQDSPKKEIVSLFEKNEKFQPIIDKLISECVAYRKLILDRLRKIQLPSGYKLEYQCSSKSNFDHLKNDVFADKIHFVSISTPKGKNNNVQIYNKINGEIAKYNKIQQLFNDLKNQNNMPQEKIANFAIDFEQKDTQNILTKNYDSAGLRFLKNVGHILTFGIISKISKGTFCFWKSKEQLMIQRMNKDLMNKDLKSVAVEHVKYRRRLLPSTYEKNATSATITISA